MEGRKKWVVKITYIGDSKPIPPTESQSIEEESRSESSLKSNASSAIAIKSVIFVPNQFHHEIIMKVKRFKFYSFKLSRCVK